jgi:DNA-binding NtrC family response regulator
MCPLADRTGRPLWRVQTVHDGDTVTCLDDRGQAVKIRLVGIDAPEYDQPHGAAARAALAAKVGGAVHIKKIDPKVLDLFEKYDWPGNIRELQNTIERLKILSDRGEITMDDIPFNIRMPRSRVDGNGANSPETSVDLSLEELEKHHILRTLSYFSNNKTRAATSLGITIKTLYNKLHKYGLLGDESAKQPLYPQ